MKKYNIIWVVDGIYQRTQIEAETESKAIEKFYAGASDRAFICDFYIET